MKLIFLTAFILSAFIVKAQDTTGTAGAGIRDSVYSKVEIESEYPGGQAAWIRYLSKTLRYPDDAVNNEIQGTVIVRFIVNRQGRVSNIEAISGPVKGGLREEAVRVIRLSGLWMPAVANGKQVVSYKKQPLDFKLTVN